MNELLSFEERNKLQIRRLSGDQSLKEGTANWVRKVLEYEYTHHFTWLGLPIIQFPQDIVAMQELIWQIKPDLIIETGIARGGSLVLYASLLELVHEGGHVLGIDIDIREKNRAAIESHPMFKRITMLEGSSIDEKQVAAVYQLASGKKRVMVMLDSNHTSEHVYQELVLYSPLVKKGSYIVVFDTVIEDFQPTLLRDRPWGKGNSPKTAVDKFLQNNKRFMLDEDLVSKLLITAAPSGYLRCISDEAN